jgi:HAMP domain-containing protein
VSRKEQPELLAPGGPVERSLNQLQGAMMALAQLRQSRTLKDFLIARELIAANGGSVHEAGRHQTMHVSKPRFLSLRWRLMGPLLGVWAMGLVLLVGILYASILERFRTLVDQRADVMVAAVYSAAETAREPADLRRFISTLGASRDVRLVTLLAGSPLRVVAASDHGLHGQPAEALDPSIAARLGEVLLSRQGWRSLDVAERRLDVLEPLLLVGSDGENGRLEDGVLQLRLDAGSLWQAAQDTVVQLSLWLGAVLSAVAGLFYLMVSRYVLRPAGAIRGVLARRRETGGDLPVPVMRRDELGELAEALNELLLTLRTRNRQLARASDQHLAMLEVLSPPGLAGQDQRRLRLVQPRLV